MDTQLLSKPTISNILAPLSQREREYVVKSTIGLMAPSHAAHEAGYKRPPKSKRIKMAVKVIQGEMARELNITMEDIQRGLLEAINIGRMQGEGNTMINGYRELAKLTGHGPPEAPRVQINQVNFNDLSEMSSEELRELARPVLEAQASERQYLEHDAD
jgi:hypothetical protein